MKALLLEGKENIQLKEIERPTCSPEGAIVKVKACGICGGDIRAYYNGFRIETDNKIMGHELTGEVIEVGEKHTKYKIGDRLSFAADIHCGECYYCKNEQYNLCDNLKILGKNVTGGFAEYFHLTEEIIDRGIVNYIPDNLSYIEAVLSEPLSSVLQAQETLEIGKGQSVLVIGAGPIGCLHAQVAKNRGADPVFIAEMNETRLELAKKNLTIDEYVNPAKEDLQKRVMEKTDGVGVDTVIVAAPSPVAVEESIKYVKKGGKIDIFGGLPKDRSIVKFDSNKIHYETIQIIGSFSYHPRFHKLALEFLADKKMDPYKFITVKNMENFDEAIEGIKQGKYLKVVLKMND